MIKFGSTEVFDERMRQTVEGNESDNLRRDILLNCLRIGLENPLIGVSPQHIQVEIGRRLPVIYGEMRVIDSHNVFGHIFAASGMICFVALFALGWTLWTWRARDGSKLTGKDDPLFDARSLLRMMVVLWVARGMFTREILYNPSFNIAVGLAIGFCLLTDAARRSRAAGPAPGGTSKTAAAGRLGIAS